MTSGSPKTSPLPTAQGAALDRWKPAKPRLLRRIHRSSAVVLGGFVVLHLGNHVAGFAGQEVHRSVQLAMRCLYQGWLEPVLLATCAVQMASGLRLIWRRRPAPWPSLLQPLSGAYLAAFLGIHVFAVLQARMSGIDTDLAFAAAGLHAGGWKFFFVPYYGLAVLALGVHLAVPLGRKRPGPAGALVLASAGLSVALLALLAGWVTPLHIPGELIRALGTPPWGSR